MRVFDFDGTIYDGESLFDLYLYSARHDPKVFRYIAPVLRYAVKYKLGRATLEQMEYGVGKMTEGYLTELSRSKRVASVEQLVYDRRFKDPDLLPQRGKCVLYGHTPVRYLTERDEIFLYPREGARRGSDKIADYCKIHLDMMTAKSGVLGCIRLDDCRCFYVRENR